MSDSQTPHDPALEAMLQKAVQAVKSAAPASASPSDPANLATRRIEDLSRCADEIEALAKLLREDIFKLGDDPETRVVAYTGDSFRQLRGLIALSMIAMSRNLQNALR